MKSITNEKLAQRRARIGQVFGLAGLAILMIGLVLSFNQEQYLLWSYVALIVGIFVSSIGIYNADKWLRPPRSDEALAQALKGFDKKYRLYNWLLPADHVLLSPYGLTVFTVKRQEGRVQYDGERWRHRQGFFQILGGLARERLGDPLRDLQADIERIKALVTQVMPDEEIPVEGVIVFVSPKVELDIKGNQVPVVPVKKLKSYLRRLHKGPKIPEPVRRELEQILDHEAST